MERERLRVKACPGGSSFGDVGLLEWTRREGNGWMPLDTSNTPQVSIYT